MKCIVRIEETVEGTTQIRNESLSAFGVKQLVDAFAKRRADFTDGLLVVEQGADDHPVYLVLSSRPPEMVAGQREVHAVFWPVDSQEPCATFFDESDAVEWAEAKFGGKYDYIVRPIDSTDKLGVQVSLMTLVWRDNCLLFCRIKDTKQWTLPEGYIGIGESTAAAARRSVLSATGVEIENIGIPGRVPYVNSYLRMAGQHFLTVVMNGTYKEGHPAALDDIYDRVEWFPAKQPPRPLFGLVEGIERILTKYDADTVRAEAP
jgi:ADP-ribose pyrophosphatase YjhB (NUDIX family)